MQRSPILRDLPHHQRARAAEDRILRGRTEQIGRQHAALGREHLLVIDRQTERHPGARRVEGGPRVDAQGGDWIGGLLADSQTGHLIDLGYAQRLLADHRAGVADHSRKVWAVAMFCLWHAITIERTINPAPLPQVTSRRRSSVAPTAVKASR
jgi:hypothetical protein